MSTFVDTSVWFAAACARDRNNCLAKSILLSLDGWTLTGHVLAETWQLLRTRFGGANLLPDDLSPSLSSSVPCISSR